MRADSGVSKEERSEANDVLAIPSLICCQYHYLPSERATNRFNCRWLSKESLLVIKVQELTHFHPASTSGTTGVMGVTVTALIACLRIGCYPFP